MTGPRRVVLDTNVVVAAGFSKRSSSARIVRAVRAGRLELVWNPRTRDETRHIVRKIPPLDWDEMSDLYVAEGEYDGEIEVAAFAVVEDPPDRVFAALAAAAGAVLVSNDSDLLDVRDELAVIVMTPSELVRRLDSDGAVG